LPVTRQLTNVTIRMAVCQAPKTANMVTAVSRSLSDAIVAAGGSVATLTASPNQVEVCAHQRVRVREGYELNERETLAVVAAVRAFSVGGRAMASQYADYQAAIDVAAPPDRQGAKIIAVLAYEADIDGFMLQKAPSTNPNPLIRSLEDLDVVITDLECVDSCVPVGVEAAPWTRVKALYRD